MHIAALVDFLSALGGQRPVTIAILVILICFVLLRPRRKPQGGGGTSSATGAQQHKLPGASVSTADVLLEFCNGAPRLKSDALEPLFRLCARFDVHLVTQLPVDSDELEAAVMATLEGAGVFGEGRRARAPTPALTRPAHRDTPRQVRPAQGDVLLHRVGPRRHVPAA